MRPSLASVGQAASPARAPKARSIPVVITAAGVAIAAVVQNRRRGCHRDRARQGHWNCNEMHDALGDGQWERPKLRLPLEQTVPEHSVMNDCEIDHEPPDIGTRQAYHASCQKSRLRDAGAGFLLWQFCLTDAWWKLHRRNDAIEMFNDFPQYGNLHGLLAADVHLKRSEVCENFHQTCPMAGLMPTAMRSRSWEDRNWLD
jgi:hypothetical protein